jgi:hypothetical protein
MWVKNPVYHWILPFLPGEGEEFAREQVPVFAGVNVQKNETV